MDPSLPTTSPPGMKRRLEAPKLAERTSKRPKLDPEKDPHPVSEAAASSSNHSQEQLCKDCQDIDFDHFLAMEIKWKSTGVHGIKICSLNHIDLNRACDLCRFFHQMKTRDRSETAVTSGRGSAGQNHELMAFSATERFGLAPAKIDDSILLAVVPTNGSEQGPQGDSNSDYSSLSGYFLPSRPNSPMLSGRKLRDFIDYDLVSSWIKFCADEHGKYFGKRCTEGGVVRGLRLIDCKTREILQANDRAYTYFALSYLWGPNTGEMGGLGNLLPTKAPQVIEDAITVTKKLGFQFLWIDRYCVPQEDGVEKHEQIHNMGKIYANAFITLIAAAGDGPGHGLPGVTRPRKPQPRIQVGSHLLVSTMPNIATEIRNSKWCHRGWTFQEALLSCRRLVFTDSQVYYQCHAMHLPECFVFPLELLHIPKRGRFHHSIELPRVFPRGVGTYPWQIEDRIQEYCERELSFDMDALNAFQGILHGFGSFNFPISHLLGVPLFHYKNFVAPKKEPTSITGRLCQGLMWKINSDAIRRPEFPSWSWVGWKNPRFVKLCGLWRSVKRSINVVRRHSYLLKIKFGFELDLHGDQAVFDWKDDSAAILSKVDSDQHPQFMELQAFNLPIECTRTDTTSKWKISFPGWYESVERSGEKQHVLDDIRAILESTGNEKFVIELSGLIVAHQQWCQVPSIFLLIVQKVGSGCYYERVAGGIGPEGYMHIPGFEHVQESSGDDIVRLGKLEVRRQAIKLR